MLKLIALFLMFLPLLITSFVVEGLSVPSSPSTHFIAILPVLLGIITAFLGRKVIQQVDYEDLKEIAGAVAMWTVPTVVWWFFWVFLWGFGLVGPNGENLTFALLMFATPAILPVSLILISLSIGRFH